MALPFLSVVSDAGCGLRMMSEWLISVRTALGAMWHPCKQLVGMVSCRQNNSDGLGFHFSLSSSWHESRVVPAKYVGRLGPCTSCCVWCWQQTRFPTAF